MHACAQPGPGPRRDDAVWSAKVAKSLVVAGVAELGERRPPLVPLVLQGRCSSCPGAARDAPAGALGGCATAMSASLDRSELRDRRQGFSGEEGDTMTQRGVIRST